MAARVSSRQPADTSREHFASDVQYYLGLQPRQLPSRYFYDALGSALFEAVCELPWYRVKRAELGLLAARGREIFDGVDHLSTIVELGGGSGEKLVALVEAGRALSTRLDLHLIDVSRSALAISARMLSTLDHVHLVTHEATYETGLAEVARERRAGGATLVLFLGSNIGNFDPPGAAAMLTGIRGSLVRGDALLIGADLVKSERTLLLAYDDPLGVTAAFNRNLLVRINRELDGDFDIDAFRHRAVWNGAASRVEMHLVSARRQTIRVGAARLAFEMREGETIWTESSYKYEPAGIVEMLARAGFSLVGQWVDDVDRFALTLVQAA